MLAAFKFVENGKESSERIKDVPKNPKYLNSYGLTELSKVRRMHRITREERELKFLENHKSKLTIASLASIKRDLLRNKWNYFCHLPERKDLQEINRQKSLTRLKWKYVELERVPADSPILETIIRARREKREAKLARKRRMIEIIEKITREEFKLKKKMESKRENQNLKNSHRQRNRKKTTIELNSQKSYKSNDTFSGSIENSNDSNQSAVDSGYIKNSEISEVENILKKESANLTPEAINNVDDHNDLKNHKINFEKVADRSLFNLNEKLKNTTFDLPPLSLEDDHEKIEKDNCLPIPTNDFERVDLGQRDNFENTVKEKQISKDTCFYAKPKIIIFKNFKPGTSYTQKVSIYNKFSKWSYIRYDSIILSILDDNVLTVEKMDAAKIRPGLFVVTTLHFLPNTETEITGTLRFLTLNSENTKDFHEFVIPIHCIPEHADPLVDPKELRFPTLPIWKYIEPGSIHKRLTISNLGLKTCSFLFTPKNNTQDSFNWDTEENEYPSVKFTCDDTPRIHGCKRNSITNYETYEVELRSKSCFQIRVTFFPKYVGLHHDIFEIVFKEDGKILKKQIIPFWAEATGSQIHLNPKFVDLGIIIMGTGVYQTNFTITNTGQSRAEVSMWIPKRLRNEIQICPKTISLQADSSWTLTVRLTPSKNILQKSKTYYDETSNILNIPIKINVYYTNEKGPTLTLKILATPTSNTLILEPDFIVLGAVNTQESILSKICITNPSLVVQDFGFLNIPPTMTIQPNYGFGRILPGETIPLHLIYSAWLTDIPGNEIEANGLSSDRKFEIRVSTVNELVGKRNHVDVINTKVPTSRLLNLPPKTQWRPPRNDLNKVARMPKRRSSSISQVVHSETLFKDLISDLTDDDDFSTDLADCDIASDSFGPLDDDIREFKNITEIFAFIVDPLCQLSEQIIEFPATPCDSFSLVTYHQTQSDRLHVGNVKFSTQGCISYKTYCASLSLMGFNSASYPHCTCGFIADQIKEFEASYEFRCSSSRVRMSPRCGRLKSREIVKITSMYKPKMLRDVTANFSESLEVTDKTIPEEMTLLENFEAHIDNEWATCALNIKMKDGTRRDENLFIKLTCPVVKPDIIILNPTRIIEFGVVAIGSKSRNILEIKNISTRLVRIVFSLLNPFGPFFMPPGKVLEPGSVLSIPITYRPQFNKDNDIEFFEIHAASTKTIWRMSLSGRGVVPSWNILPEMRVARLEAKVGKPDEIKFTIENTCEATLVFVLEIIELLEGSIPVKLKGSKSPKGNKERRTSMFLEKEEESAIFDEKLKPLDNEEYFTFTNFEENLRLPVEAMKARDFILRFQVPSTRVSFSGNKSEKSKKRIGVATSGVVRKDRRNATGVYYVARLKLLLEDVRPVQDILLIGTVKF